MATPKFKVLLTSHHSRVHSGSAMQLLLLAKELLKRGHAVHALFKGHRDAGPHPSLEQLPEIGVKLDLVNFTIMKYKHTIPELYWLWRYLLREQFDVVNCFGGTDLSHIMISATGMFVPVLIAYRGLAEPLDPFNSIKYRMPKVRRIIANSEAVKRVMVKSGRINPGKIAVVYGGFDIDKFKPETEGSLVRKEFGIPASAPVVIIIGHLKFIPEHRKGGYYFALAAEKVLAQRPEAKFLLVGKVDEKKFMEVASERLKQACILTGFRTDVPELIAASDVLINSSLSEGMAGVIREAFAMGKPVVATEIDGTPELVKPGKTGILVPAKDPEALARGILDLINNPSAAKEMGRLGRELALALCRNESRVDKYEQIYFEQYEKATARPHPWLHWKYYRARDGRRRERQDEQPANS